jgi:hypothetical protein
VYDWIQQNKTKRGTALESFFKDIGDVGHFQWGYLEEREEGEKQFELDRLEIITSKLYFMKGRFDPLFKHPILT